ncbi:MULTISPECIES: TOBE domain-containing protein [Providencia]|uniref:TOBE domain-containing protein n=1 Tax=Providencia huaxiensis TaxID=2027290 RepID=A0A8I2AGB7_9GAMM|nr:MULTISPECIES: TOBE domain-containing protein [Providencia]MBZ3682046.1 TOBE domain-containing protein [Providencia rettgeri]MBN6363506.1 TOBE domain-containing protein [Providencia huaxiensis]MBQ0268645.1 TOBE domain-containing protein [Providencia huaxiensis]MBQ0535506.1 TOBE domain-containing protein [Providencia huaxiensis]MBQ0589891.1 TOBE domain-containing protein [Providencia huaxiensis]
MAISARNQLSGVVESIVMGAVNDEIILDLGNGESIAAVITKNSTKQLGLEKGKVATAVIKAPWVVLVSNAEEYNFSARNQFNGVIESIEKGSVNSVVNLKTSAGTLLSAVVTNNSTVELGLNVKSKVTAIIKASSVILATKK